MANGPPGGHAVWLTGCDGVRVRAGIWPEGDRGTVFLFPGRTEYVEKYSDAARYMRESGYASVSIDWRGQGLTQRPLHDRSIGHVNDFKDFQNDIDVLSQYADSIGLPRPWYLVAHSMGGLIGLRSLIDGTSFARAVFSAPMWGLPIAPHLRACAWSISSAASVLGLGDRKAPAAGKAADPTATPFAGNLLTTDPEMFAWMKRQIGTYPDLALGGPSLGWLWAALREMHTLAREPAPAVPCLTVLGTQEAIVDADAIHVRLASWPGSRLEIVPGARHEALMETRATRDQLYGTIVQHFDAAPGSQNP